MKIQTAKLNYLRIAPRKVRLVADLIKGLPINEAEAQLLVNPKKISEPLLKLLRSAISNAKTNQGLRPESLYVKEIRVDQGPSLKRQMPRAHGRATLIQKKTSHISLTLSEGELKPPRFKIVKPEKISKIKARKIEKAKPKAVEKEEIKASTREGFIRRLFRRKAV